MSKHPITLTINDQEYNIYVAGHHTLLQVMRDQLDLTEVKYGCGRGECGACSVLVDDSNESTGRKVVDACLDIFGEITFYMKFHITLQTDRLADRSNMKKFVRLLRH